jgi:ABC-type multidrug transport system permease subunit
VSALAVARATLRKDLLEARAHRSGFASGALGVLATLLLLAGTARFVAPEGAGTAAGGPGALGFLVVGVALFSLHDALVRELPRRVRAAQLEGTLEAVLAGRAGLAAVACALPLAPLLRAAARGGALIAAASLLAGLDLAWENAALALPLLALATLLFAAIGLAATAATIAWGGAERAIALYGALTALLGGVFFPADALPAPFADLARWVPLRHALEPLRGVLLGTAGPAATLPALLPLAAGALLLPVSLLLLRGALRRALREGTLGG